MKEEGPENKGGGSKSMEANWPSFALISSYRTGCCVLNKNLLLKVYGYLETEARAPEEQLETPGEGKKAGVGRADNRPQQNETNQEPQMRASTSATLLETSS